VLDVSSWSKDLAVEIAGRDVINHVGAALRLLADRSGLTGRLSQALACRRFVPVHDRGRVLADTAVLIADGGRVMSDLATLRDQAELYGPIASNPTLWRTLDEIDEPQRRRISRVQAKTREHVWSLITKRHGQIPLAGHRPGFWQDNHALCEVISRNGLGGTSISAMRRV
jgi:hypothetical protein